MGKTSVRCFLVTTCFISLAFILCRFALVYHDTFASKLKIYSIYIGGNKVKLQQDGTETTGIINSSNIKTTEAKQTKKEIYDHRTNFKTTYLTIPSMVWAKSTTISVIAPTRKQGIENKPITVALNTPLAVLNTKPRTKPATTKQNIPEVSTKPTIVTSNVNSGELNMCSKQGEKLIGALAVDQEIPDTEADIDKVWDEKGWVEKGGAWRPTKCKAVSKVAIIIPYRNREQQLKIFLRHIHPILKRQLLDYRIIVIEQNGDTPFNRAMLFNVGYKESLKFHDFQCFIFHDVDLLPENDKNYYGCPSAPRHLSVAVDKFNYRLPYQTIFGGAGAFNKNDFEAINGFSNRFWGWGGEDDDLYHRINAKKLKLTRPNMNVGRYKMVRIFHKSAKADPKRFEKLRSSKQRMSSDGLNSLKYKVVNNVEHSLYTMVTVEVDPNAV